MIVRSSPTVAARIYWTNRVALLEHDPQVVEDQDALLPLCNQANSDQRQIYLRGAGNG